LDKIRLKWKYRQKTGTEKEYDVLIVRAKSNNAYLKSLFAEEGELYEVFDKTKTEYTMKVQHNVDHLTLEVIPEDSDATYEIIGNSNFVYGDNLVTVCVIASDRSYKIRLWHNSI